MHAASLITRLKFRNARFKRAGGDVPPGFADVLVGDRFVYRGGQADLATSGEDAAAPIWFEITNSDQDRDGDIILPEGLHFENWQKAGAVWFWNHQQHPLPIGSSLGPDGRLALKAEGNRVLAGCHFDQGSAFAQEVRRLVAKGLIRGASIGFQPLEIERLRPEHKAASGRRNSSLNGHLIREADLLEITITPVGANPGALRLELAKGYSEYAKKSLAPFCKSAKCGGEGSGKPGPCPKPGADAPASTTPHGSPALHAKAEQASASWMAKAKHVPAAVMGKAKAKIKSHYQRLEGRYGRPMALAILGAGIAGTAVPLPGTSLLAAAPLIGAAEIYRALRGAKVATVVAKAADDGNPSDDEIAKLAQEFIAEVLADWQAEGPFDAAKPSGVNSTPEKRAPGMSKKWRKAKKQDDETEDIPSPVEEVGGPDEPEPQGTDIQALSLSKEQFPTQEEAASWVEAQGYAAGDVTDAGDAWVFTQFPVEELVPDTQRTEDMGDGVTATVGQQQIAEGEPEGEPVAETPEEEMKAEDDMPMEDEPAPDEMMDEESLSDGGALVRPDKPSKAALLGLKEYLKASVPMQENPEFVRALDKASKILQACAMKIYPDDDWSDWPMAAEEEQPPEDQFPEGDEGDGDDEEYAAEKSLDTDRILQALRPLERGLDKNCKQVGYWKKAVARN